MISIAYAGTVALIIGSTTYIAKLIEKQESRLEDHLQFTRDHMEVMSEMLESAMKAGAELLVEEPVEPVKKKRGRPPKKKVEE